MDSIGLSSRKQFSQLAWLVAIALVARALTGLSDLRSLQEDPDAYAQLAVGLSEKGVFGFASENLTLPTAFRPPFYPWLLSWFVSDSKLLPGGVFALHLALGIAIAVTTYAIALKLQLRWPMLAGLLVVIDPLLIRAGQQVMTELLATLLAVAVWWLWLIIWADGNSESLCKTTTRSAGKWVALYSLGIAFGLSILARPTAMPWAVLCVASMTWFGCVCWKRRVVDSLVVTTGILLLIVPWTLRNMQTLGKPIWATTHGGYTLFLANNPSLYQHFRDEGPSRNWDVEPFHIAWANRGKVNRKTLEDPAYWLGQTALVSQDLVELGGGQVHSLGELADDSLAYDLAIQTIKSDPKTFALSCIYRLSWLWAWWPNGVGTLMKLAVGSWYGMTFVLAIQGFYKLLMRKGSKPIAFQHQVSALGNWVPGIALIVILSAIHCLFWSNMRMRAPAMPCVYLLALIPLADAAWVNGRPPDSR